MRTASVEGLEGLTIGRLADELEMTKSGLFGLFGSKEGLQLAALEAGIDVFLSEVWEPVAAMKPGRKRLLALCDRWISFHERRVLPGGCFMTMAVVEWDSREGRVHDAVAFAMRRWLKLLAADVAAAVEWGELPPGTSPADVAFQLNAFAAAASCGHQLTGDTRSLEQARRSMQSVLSPAR